MGKELKLNQIIAITNGQKSNYQKTIAKLYHDLEKKDLFSGLSREYAPIDEEGEKLPPEKKMVQLTVKNVIDELSRIIEKTFDDIGKQDSTNCLARVDVIVDEKVILKNVPVTYLLFLEKQITDLKTFIDTLPILDPAEDWNFDPNVGYYVTNIKQNNRTKKVPRTIVKYEATKEHPAQTEVYYEDITIGYWNSKKFSGCMSKKEKDDFLEKLAKLDRAVKIAREEANNTTVIDVSFGKDIVDYLFS